MESNKYILVEDCCRHYSIELSFVRELNDQGLIELKQTDGMYFIDNEYIGLLEKYVHFYYDLDINMEGIEAISHLLKKVEHLQAELRSLKGSML